jgi:hypothetical protein
MGIAVDQEDRDDPQDESGHPHHAGVGHGPRFLGLDARDGRDGGGEGGEAEEQEPAHEPVTANAMPEQTGCRVLSKFAAV